MIRNMDIHGHRRWNVVCVVVTLLSCACTEEIIEHPCVTLRLPPTIELSMEFLEVGRNCGFDPSLRKPPIKSSLACRVLEPILKVG